MSNAKEPLTGATVLFVKSDSIVGGAATDSKGRFQLKGLPAGDYECRVSMLGYKPASKKFTLTDKTKLPQFILEEDAKALAEVTVTVDPRMMTKELAGMSIYYLSERAKNESNAYNALKEIPRLIIDPINHSIQLNDRRSPLILVNGIKKSLSAIDPKIIESVEIIDNPSARYRGNADVTAVLNVKVKKDGIQPYLRGEAGIISMLNTHFMWNEGTLETGSATSSFYANATYERLKNTRSDLYSDIIQGNLHRVESGIRRGSHDNPSVRIGGDKEFSKKNYIAYRAEYAASTTKSSTNSSGNVTDISTGEESLLTSKYSSKTPYRGVTGNLYYKHSFTSDRVLEFDGKYTYSKNSSEGQREENSSLYNYISDIDLYNTRHSGGLDANYSDMLSSSLHFEAGSNTDYSVTNIDDRVDAFPKFRYRRTQEYLYAGIDNNRSKSPFNYVLSLGLDMVFTDADGVKHDYIDFLPSASLAYRIDRNQSVKFSYSRSRSLPSTNYLNPRNISTDSLKMVVGNPMLSPSYDNNLRLGYVFGNEKLMLDSYLQYIYRTDLIQPRGYMENDIYVNTYQNYGHSSEMEVGINFNYYLPCGFVALSPFFAKDYIKGMPYTGNRFGLILNSNINYRNVSISGFFNVIPARSYSLYSKNISAPMGSRVHVVWRPVPSWAFTFTAQQFLFPRVPYKSWTINGDYKAYTRSVERSQAPRIAFGVWYTFVSRNFKWRNKKSFKNGDRTLENLKVD
ncbi:MAG: TonB-dependent receptor [Muribaculaceae bacterium]|nr:TonB-dependent receptor [Muribaculaceae bacterium]